MANTEKRDFKFDKRADKYDDHFEGKLSRVFYELIYENIELSDSAQVLDVGCGTGTILKTLSERFNIVAHGIDVENEMLKVAKAKCSGMDIQLCSCEATPFADNSLDAVIACMAYHHFPDKQAFENEAARILITSTVKSFAIRDASLQFISKNSDPLWSAVSVILRIARNGIEFA